MSHAGHSDVPHEVPVEFRVPLGSRLVLPGAFLLLAALPVKLAWMVVVPDSGAEPDLWVAVAAVGTALVVSLFLVVTAFAYFRARLRLYDRWLEVRAFSTRRVDFDACAGFSRGTNPQFTQIVLVPKDGRSRRVSLAPIDDRFEEVVAWIEARLPDLDGPTVDEDDFDALTSDVDLGDTAEQRLEALARSKRVCLALNVTAGCATIWTALFSFLYPLGVGLCTVLPVLALVVLHVWRGTTRLEPRPSRLLVTPVFASPMAAVWFPGVGMATRTLGDWPSLDTARLVGYGAVVMVAWVVAYNLLVPEVRRRVLLQGGLCFAYLAYGFGLMGVVNGAFDRASPVTHEVEVIGKYVSRSSRSGRSYMLKVAPWHDDIEAISVEVGSHMYDRIENGHPVRVREFPGALGARWYVVDVH